MTRDYNKIKIILIMAFSICSHTIALPANSQTKNIKPTFINIEQRRQVRYDNYILGAGDSLAIEIFNIPELSGIYSISPDGTLYLPRLRTIYASGLTIEQLKSFLTQEYSRFLKQPRIYLRPVSFRPIRVFVGGEVRRPGFYQLSSQVLQNQNSLEPKLNSDASISSAASPNNFLSGPSQTTSLPTVFDALQKAQGFTVNSDLRKVTVTRKLSEGDGGGKILTELNFLDVITTGNDTQNVRLMDGDAINVSKSNLVLIDQLIKANQTNIAPQFIEVFVSGRVKQPGKQVLPQLSTLNQAILSAGGIKIIRGKVEFIRFKSDGEVDRRLFNYNPGAPTEAPFNPILVAGDIIRVNDSILSSSLEVTNELTAPAFTFFSIYNLFQNFK